MIWKHFFFFFSKNRLPQKLWMISYNFFTISFTLRAQKYIIVIKQLFFSFLLFLYFVDMYFFIWSFSWIINARAVVATVTGPSATVKTKKKKWKFLKTPWWRVTDSEASHLKRYRHNPTITFPKISFSSRCVAWIRWSLNVKECPQE